MHTVSFRSTNLCRTVTYVHILTTCAAITAKCSRENRGVSNQAKLATRFINLKIFKDFGDFLRFSRFIEILRDFKNFLRFLKIFKIF